MVRETRDLEVLLRALLFEFVQNIIVLGCLAVVTILVALLMRKGLPPCNKVTQLRRLWGLRCRGEVIGDGGYHISQITMLVHI